MDAEVTTEEETDFVVKCQETGKEFESVEEFQDFKQQQVRDKALTQIEAELDQVFGVNAEELVSEMDADFEEVVEGTIADAELALDLIPEDSERLAGHVLHYVGLKKANGNIPADE